MSIELVSKKMNVPGYVVSGLASGALLALAYRKGLQRGREKQSQADPTEAEIYRGYSALYPFVKKWKLPLNPENLELMSYAVTKHSGKPGIETDITKEEEDHIDSDVSEMIDRFDESIRKMHKSWQDSIGKS